MSAHYIKLLLRLYGFVLRRMHASNRAGFAPAAVARWTGLEPLEPRILFSVSPLGAEPLPTVDLDTQTSVIVDWDTRDRDEAAAPATHTALKLR